MEDNIIEADSTIFKGLTLIKNGNDGCCGKCFSYGDDLILKKFNIPYKCKYDLQRFIEFTKLNNSTVVFPKKIIVSKNKIIGYTMERVHGNVLSSALDNIEFDDIDDLFGQVEEDLWQISTKQVYSMDLHRNNVMYDGSFRIIDTDEYFVNINKSDERCFTHNIEAFTKAIVTGTLYDASLVDDTQLLCGYLDFVGNNVSCDIRKLKKLLYMFKDVLENKYEHEIKTFGDIKKVKVR